MMQQLGNSAGAFVFGHSVAFPLANANPAQASPSLNRRPAEFHNGMMQGRGTFKYANGDVYEGEFKDDKQAEFDETDRTGACLAGTPKHPAPAPPGGRVAPACPGILEHPGTTLPQVIGQFQPVGKPHGYGVFTFKEGAVYEGEFQEEIMEGVALPITPRCSFSIPHTLFDQRVWVYLLCL